MTTTLDLAAIDYSDWMKAALKLAAQGKGRTQPNPAVGAVVLDSSGALVGEGFHERAGGPHAEAIALSAAGPRARGGTLLVTLEPCCHIGRTPACTQAILESGIRRVVATHADPDVRVSGRGFDLLRHAGVEVVTDIEAEAAAKLNERYLHFKRTGKPWVTLKLALSLDGRIADGAGYSRWITSEACRRHAHLLRSTHEAILVGAGTALADDPELSLHDAGGTAPQRFVLAGQRDLPTRLKLFGGEAPAFRVGVDERADWVLPPDACGRPELSALLDQMGQRGYSTLLVEGGGKVAASFLAGHHVAQVVLYYAPLFLGEATAALSGTRFELRNAPALSDLSVETLEGGFVVSGGVKR